MTALRNIISRRAAIAALWTLAGALAANTLCVRIHDLDFWWQLAAGREIVGQGALLHTDIFSHTLQGAPWIDFEWLGQILLFLVYDAGGFPAILAAKIGLGLVVVALLAWSCRRQGLGGPWLLLAAATGFMVLRHRMTERLELATFLFLPLFVALLASARDSDRRTRKRLLWTLGACMVLWCNLHAGFIYGIAAAVLFGFGARWAGEKADYIRTLDLAAGVLLAAAMVNPYGPKLFTLFVEHAAQLGRGASLIQEWRPTDLASAPWFWAIFLLSGAGLAWGLLTGKRQARFWAPAVFVFAAAGGLSYRANALLAFFALPFLADLAGTMTQEFRDRWTKAAWLGCAAALFALARPPALSAFSDPVYWKLFPTGACRFIAAHEVDGAMYNAYDFGGYIEWALGPERKVFMDGRYPFYRFLEEDTRLNKRLESGPSANLWAQYFRLHEIDYAVMDYEELTFDYTGIPYPVSLIDLMFPRSAWALVQWDDAAMLFLKREPQNADLIREFEYRYIWPHNLPEMRLLLDSKTVDAAAVKKELERHTAAEGFTVSGHRVEQLLEGRP